MNQVRGGKKGTHLEVLKEIVNPRLDIERVQPKRKYSRLPLSLSIKLLHNRNFNLLERLKSRVGVEQMSNESQVELWVAGDERRGREVLSAVDRVCVLEDLLGSLEQVGRLEGRTRAVRRLELVEQDRVVFTVADVLGKVGDSDQSKWSGR